MTYRTQCYYCEECDKHYPESVIQDHKQWCPTCNAKNLTPVHNMTVYEDGVFTQAMECISCMYQMLCVERAHNGRYGPAF